MHRIDYSALCLGSLIAVLVVSIVAKWIVSLF